MGIGMVAYGVAFFCHAFNQFRMFGNEGADYEKGGWNLVLF